MVGCGVVGGGEVEVGGQRQAAKGEEREEIRGEWGRVQAENGREARRAWAARRRQQQCRKAKGWQQKADPSSPLSPFTRGQQPASLFVPPSLYCHYFDR